MLEGGGFAGTVKLPGLFEKRTYPSGVTDPLPDKEVR